MEKKFRLYNKTLKVWLNKSVTDNDTAISLMDERIIFYWDHDSYSCGKGKYGNDEYVIQQWTGWWDRWHKEIYEGDIIKIDALNISGYGVAEFNGSSFGIWVDSNNGKKALTGEQIIDGKFEPLDEFYVTTLEIVGNIFENPEYLAK